jgi:hypothetical protein
MFVSRPFLKIGMSCTSALLLITANASARDSHESDSQSFRIAQAELDLAFDVRYLKSHGVENFGDLFKFDRGDFGGGHSFAGEDSDHSGKSSKGDRDDRFSLGKRDGWHFEFVDSRHDDHGWGNDHGRGNDWGGNDPFCGGFPQNGNGGGDCHGGDSNGCGNPIGVSVGGDPIGSTATPEPSRSALSIIAAGAMALLLAGRKVRRRIGLN